MQVRLALSLVIVVVLVACSSRSGEGPGPEDEEFSCDRYCMQWARCSDAEYVAEDMEKCANTCQIIKPEVGVRVTECLEERSCEESDDRCYDEALDAVGTSEQVDRFGVDCFVRVAECERDFGDDICSQAGLLRDEYVAGLEDCLNEDCAATEDCIDRVLTYED